MDHEEQDRFFERNEKTISSVVMAFQAFVNMVTIARDYFDLSRREVEVLQLQAEGLKIKETASQLEASPHTV